MAGAECGRRLDLDADAMAGHAGAVVRAMHDEAAGLDRLQSGEAFLDPVARRNALDDYGARRFLVAGERDHLAQFGLHGLLAEMNVDLPAFVRPLEGRAYDLGRIE